MNMTDPECSEISCSNVFDEVCGVARTANGISVIRVFHNACHLKRIKCKLKPYIGKKRFLVN